MDIKKTALAGTLESSDIQITLSQGNNGINIDLDSSVEELYGNQIRKVITDTLTAYGIDNAVYLLCFLFQPHRLPPFR